MNRNCPLTVILLSLLLLLLLLLVLLLLFSYFKEMTGDYETSLSLKCQSLHLLNLLPSIWSIKSICRSTQRTSIRIDRFISESTSYWNKLNENVNIR